MNIITFIICLFSMLPADSAALRPFVKQHGGIVRGDTTQKTVHLVFTGHEFADGADTIIAVLGRHRVRGSFFFTGDFYRTEAFQQFIRSLRHGGHYLGGHSDKHLLYAPWEKRDSLLVSKREFSDDLEDNYRAMEPFGVTKKNSPFFLPPYEWYNDSISAWCSEAGLTLVNFTPGTSSNADYTIPEEKNYVPSDSIYRRILQFESSRPNGLNGFLLLLHFGTHPHRTDKFYLRLDALITELERRGYRFRRVLDY
jgi:peptidoglycan/xylan/chitin deacetylase (PgdA/CDA1 family)